MGNRTLEESLESLGNLIREDERKKRQKQLPKGELVHVSGPQT